MMAKSGKMPLLRMTPYPSIGIGGGFAAAPLRHHRAYGSVPRRFSLLAALLATDRWGLRGLESGNRRRSALGESARFSRDAKDLCGFRRCYPHHVLLGDEGLGGGRGPPSTATASSSGDGGERLRLRFLKSGSNGFADYEAVEQLLTLAIPRVDVKPPANALVTRFGSLRGILDAPIEELQQVQGIGSVALVALRILREVATFADRTWDGQARGNGIAGNEDLIGIGSLSKGLLNQFWKSTLLLRHELAPIGL
jgi:hypothetical protein